MIRQHEAIALANIPPPAVPGFAAHQAAEAEVRVLVADYHASIEIEAYSKGVAGRVPRPNPK